MRYEHSRVLRFIGFCVAEHVSVRCFDLFCSRLDDTKAHVVRRHELEGDVGILHARPVRNTSPFFLPAAFKTRTVLFRFCCGDLQDIVRPSVVFRLEEFFCSLNLLLRRSTPAAIRCTDGEEFTRRSPRTNTAVHS